MRVAQEMFDKASSHARACWWTSPLSTMTRRPHDPLSYPAPHSSPSISSSRRLNKLHRRNRIPASHMHHLVQRQATLPIFRSFRQSSRPPYHLDPFRTTGTRYQTSTPRCTRTTKTSSAPMSFHGPIPIREPTPIR